MRISGWSSDVCSSDLQWLEEAAGISKYKDRRKETESRIKQTRENLSRLNDLRSEIQQRLEVLTKQAANAEKYRDLKTQERKLRAEILALRMRQFEDSGRGQETAITDFEQAMKAAPTRVHNNSEARVAAEIEQREIGRAHV